MLCTFPPTFVLWSSYYKESAYPSYLIKISTLQDKVVKLVGGGAFQDKATPFYYNLNIPKLTDWYKIEISKLMYNTRCV